MDIKPVGDYRSPEYPRAGEGEAELLRATPRRWGRHALVATILAGGLSLTGFAYGPVSEDLIRLVDRAAIALHLRQPPPVRVMGAMRMPRLYVPQGTVTPASQGGQTSSATNNKP